jgi:hypothetical protein
MDASSGLKEIADGIAVQGRGYDATSFSVNGATPSCCCLESAIIDYRVKLFY